MITVPDLPDQAVRDHLATNVAGLSLSNVFRGKMRPRSAHVPTSSVFCLLDGGGVNAPYLNGRSDLRTYAVAITIRSEPDAFGAGQDLAHAILAVLHRAELAGFFSTLVEQSAPGYMGEDDEGAHVWLLTATLRAKVVDP